MTTGEYISPQTRDAVRAELPGRSKHDINTALDEATVRIARLEESPGPQEVVEPNGLREVLTQADEALEQATLAACGQSATAQDVIRQLITEKQASSDSYEEVPILEALARVLEQQSASKPSEIAERREVDMQTLAVTFRKCLRQSVRAEISGDNPPSDLREFRQRLHDLGDAVSNALRIEPQDYATIKPEASYSYALAQADQGKAYVKDDQMVEVLREVAREFVTGILRRWLMHKSVPVIREVGITPSGEHKQKTSEKLTPDQKLPQGEKFNLLVTAVAEMVDALVDAMPNTKQGFDAQWGSGRQRLSSNGDPFYDRAMDIVSGYFFDGFDGDLSTAEQNVGQASVEDISATCRGAIIRALVDGVRPPADLLPVIGKLTLTDAVAIARVVQKMREGINANDEGTQTKMAIVLKMLPQEALMAAKISPESIWVDDRDYQPELQRAGERVADRVVPRIIKHISTRYLYGSSNLAGEANDMRFAERQSQRDEALVNVIRRVVLAQIIDTEVRETITRHIISSDPTRLIAQLEQLSGLEPPYSITHATPTSPPGLYDAVHLKLHMIHQLLNPAIVNTGLRATQTAVETIFSQASRFGVTKEELIAIHNKVGMAVVEVNTSLSRNHDATWVQQNGLNFTDTLGGIKPEITGATYSTKSLANGLGVQRLSKMGSPETTPGTIAVYLANEDEEPRGNPDRFKPPAHLTQDIAVLENTREALVEQDKIATLDDRVKEQGGLEGMIKRRTGSGLWTVREDAVVAPGYESLVKQNGEIMSAIKAVSEQIPNISETLSTEQTQTLREYLDPNKFPEGLRNGSARGIAKRTLQDHVYRTYGVTIGDFKDTTEQSVLDAQHLVQEKIEAALSARKKQAWDAFDQQSATLGTQLKQTVERTAVTAQAFAELAIKQHQQLGPDGKLVTGLWHEFIPPGGEPTKEKAAFINLGAQAVETGVLNVIAKVSREAAEAYRACAQPIGKAFRNVYDTAVRGDWSKADTIRDTVLFPAWQVIQPGSQSFDVPMDILPEFMDALRPYIQQIIKSHQDQQIQNETPAQRLAKTHSPVTQAVGNKLQES